MRLNMALPCRVSVYTEKGKTQIGIIQPAPMLMSLSQDQSLTEVAKEVQEKITEMIDSAKWTFLIGSPLCAVIDCGFESVYVKHVRNGVETLCVPTFEQNQEILQSTLTTFACTLLRIIKLIRQGR